MTKHVIISDPFPRSLDLIFTKQKLKELKKKYKLIKAPHVNKKNFMKKILKRLLLLWVNPNLIKIFYLKQLN